MGSTTYTPRFRYHDLNTTKAMAARSHSTILIFINSRQFQFKNVFDAYSMPLLFSSLFLRMGSWIRRDHGQEKKGKKKNI
jgi:hypothetical protein